MICHRPSCGSKLLTLPDSPNYMSISIRCKCGARYRISYKNGEHNIEKVVINDLNLATVAHIKRSRMPVEDKVDVLSSIISRSVGTREATNEAYGTLIRVAESLKQNLLE